MNCHEHFSFDSREFLNYLSTLRIFNTIMNYTYHFKELIKNSEKAYLQCRMLSKPRKLFFDHLPKCGGTTLHNFLLKHYRPEKVFRIISIRKGGPIAKQVQIFTDKPEEERYSYDLIFGHHTFQFMDDIHPEMYKITMLREPVDRIISHYYFVKRFKNHHLHEQVMSNQMSLESYVTSGISEELDNWYVKHFSGLDEEKVYSDPDYALACAKRNLARFDCIGVLSQMDDFISKLRKDLSLKGTFDNNRRVNKTEGRPKVSDVSPKAIEEVKRMNSLDIALYEWVLENLRSGTLEKSHELHEEFSTIAPTPGH